MRLVIIKVESQTVHVALNETTTNILIFDLQEALQYPTMRVPILALKLNLFL